MGKSLLKKPFFLVREPGRTVKDGWWREENEKVWIENLNEFSGLEMPENQQLGKTDSLKVAFINIETSCQVFFSVLPMSWHCGSVLILAQLWWPLPRDKRLLTSLSHLACRMRRMETTYEISDSSALQESNLRLKNNEEKAEEFFTSFLSVALVSKLSSRLCAQNLYVVL